MKKSELHELRKYAGDLSGIYGMQEYTFTEGKAQGLRAIELKNGNGLRATFLPDRCLDIPYLSYRDTNLALITKAGLSHPAFYSPGDPRSFLRQFNAGLLTTCGLSNVGGSCENDGRNYPMHGEIGNTPAKVLSKTEVADNDSILLQLEAEIKDACVFGEHIVLKRKIQMETEQNIIHIYDCIENRDFSIAPYMLLYHINLGYPLLAPGAKVYFSTKKVDPRDDTAKKKLHKHDIIEEPTANRPEECFTHTGGDGIEFAMLHNEKLGLAVAIHYDTNELPYLHEWKSMKAGDYALGLEPSSSGFLGFAQSKQDGTLKYLEPGKSAEYHLIMEVLDDVAQISSYIAKCAK